MRIGLSFFCLLFSSMLFAQKGDELLVYSLKGNVTVIEDYKESKLRIGKVLKPGSTIKTQKEAKLTMVCKQGKPLSVTREGVFPVTKWKDSCAITGDNSMTAKYFQYIWDQLYIRSDDYKKEYGDQTAAVVRGEAPVRGEDDIEILFNEALDTVFYATGSFPLSWEPLVKYGGKYFFRLFDLAGVKALYQDSISGNSIMIDKFKKYMKPGRSYKWTLTTKKTGEQEGGVINYLLAKTVSQQISKFQKPIDVPEDLAAQYFRVAYLLENSHYLPAALLYYKKAATAAPDVEFYQEKLDEFKKTFFLPTM
jgi:hypothetical protein